MLEGGGQVLRLSVSSSVVQGKPVSIHSIRGGRPKPGLQAQHLTGMSLVARMCGGELVGCCKGSTEASLAPSAIRSGAYSCDTKTAGAVTLLLQVSLPCALFAPAPTRLHLLGGTDVPHAPPIAYLEGVMVPLAALFGAHFTVQVERRGFFPRGGGCCYADILPLAKPLTPVTLTERGELTAVEGCIYGSAAVCGEVQALVAAALKHLSVPVTVRLDPQPGAGDAFGLTLIGITSTGMRLAGCALSDKSSRLSAGAAAKGAVGALLAALDSGACVDDHAQDQLIILMALAAGRSSMLCAPLTSHTTTAIEVLKITTQAKFEVTPKDNNLFLVECEGIGLGP